MSRYQKKPQPNKQKVLQLQPSPPIPSAEDRARRAHIELQALKQKYQLDLIIQSRVIINNEGLLKVESKYAWTDASPSASTKSVK